MKAKFTIMAVCIFLICGQLFEINQSVDHECHERDCFVCPCKTDEYCFNSKSAPSTTKITTVLITSIKNPVIKTASNMLRGIRAPPGKRKIKPYVYSR